MFDGSDPCWIPMVPIGKDQEWRLRRAQFGDGYEQRILDGINALNTTFNVSFPLRPSDVLIAMDSYLSSLNGAAFLFADPASGAVYSVFCDKWSISWDVRRRGGKYYGSLSAAFERANGVAIGPIT